MGLPGTKAVALENYQYQAVQRENCVSSGAGEQDGGNLVSWRELILDRISARGDEVPPAPAVG